MNKKKSKPQKEKPLSIEQIENSYDGFSEHQLLCIAFNLSGRKPVKYKEKPPHTGALTRWVNSMADKSYTERREISKPLENAMLKNPALSAKMLLKGVELSKVDFFFLPRPHIYPYSLPQKNQKSKYKYNRKDVKIINATDMELNDFVGRNYAVLREIFPTPSCDELKQAFGEVLNEWAKFYGIKNNLIEEFYSYADSLLDYNGVIEMRNGCSGYPAEDSITFWDGKVVPTRYLWTFGEMGKYLALHDTNIIESQKIRIIIIFLRGCSFKEISKIEHVSTETIRDVINCYMDRFVSTLRFGMISSKFELWLSDALANAYPSICFVLNDWTAIGMELDVFIPSLKLAFEINGVTHYKPIYGEESLLRRQVIDFHKRRCCTDNGIQLVTIDVTDVKQKWEPEKTLHHFEFIKKVIASTMSGKCVIERGNVEAKQVMASYRQKEKLFVELTSGIEQKQYPNYYNDSVFYLGNGKIIFEHNDNTGRLVYSNILGLEFARRFEMREEDVDLFMEDMVKKHCGLKNIKAIACQVRGLERWKRLDEIDKKPLPTKEGIFLEYISKLTKKEDRKNFPNSIFYIKSSNKGKRLIFEFNEKTGILSYSYLLSEKLQQLENNQTEYSSTKKETDAFVKIMARKHLKIKCTPSCNYNINYEDDDKMMVLDGYSKIETPTKAGNIAEWVRNIPQ